jgi:hypothetical protein
MTLLQRMTIHAGKVFGKSMFLQENRGRSIGRNAYQLNSKPSPLPHGHLPTRFKGTFFS